MNQGSLPMQERKSRVSGKALCLLPALAVLAAVIIDPWGARSSLSTVSFVLGTGCAERPQLPHRTAMKVHLHTLVFKTPYTDPEGLRQEEMRRQWRQEKRAEFRSNPVPQNPVNFSKLPSMEDIFERRFSGSGLKDAIGGRARYSIIILFNADKLNLFPGNVVQTEFEKVDVLEKEVRNTQEFILKSLSGKELKVYTRTPGTGARSEDIGQSLLVKRLLEKKLRGQKARQLEKANIEEREALLQRRLSEVWQLETPMRVYGEFETRRDARKKDDNGLQQWQIRTRPVTTRALVTQWDVKIPPSAIYHLQRYLYSRQAVVRFMALKVTRSWRHTGEDNELKL